MSSNERKAYAELYALAKTTRRQLKELRANCDRDNPVDMDMVKTTKAMFYENAISIFKKYKEEE